ncbi:hypothetical protein [Agriterribacter sp.]|uniref:hypothetical protein n=1 Tax=Agriterribacter sp. TaxID=2821509 RepID=UPI002D1FB885|nr:hypothetical protein [Agriterribacter sp.]
MGGHGSGGGRKGAGRKKKWQEQTETIAFRWPASFVEELRAIKNANEWVYKQLKNGVQKQRGTMPEDGRKD